MTIAPPVVALVIAALLLGLLIGWLAAGRKAAAAEAGRLSAEQALGIAQSDNGRLRAAFEQAIRDLATASEREKSTAEQINQLQQLREDTEQKFGSLADAALRASEQAFLRLANETFEKHREGNRAELETKRQELDALVSPLKETLTRYEEKLGAVEKERADAYGGLREMVEQMRVGQDKVGIETMRLANALKGSAKMRGHWGEQQLRNVLEKAGLSPYADFRTEVSVDTDDGRKRPDVIVRLPGGRQLIIDAKASLSAYQAATEAEDDSERRGHLLSHAKAMKQRAQELGDKSYQRDFRGAADFVVMFVPGEHFVHAALEHDPDLWDDAFARGVLIATPTNLIALARTIAQSWRQEKMNDDAQQIAEHARELYKRMITMGDHFARVSKSLDQTVRAYNGLLGSLETSVLPHARKFTELNVEGAAQQIATTPQVESGVRQPAVDRDLRLVSSQDDAASH